MVYSINLSPGALSLREAGRRRIPSDMMPAMDRDSD
jgi:hypothetical protein